MKQTEKPSQTRFAGRSDKDENTPPQPQQSPSPIKRQPQTANNRQSGQKALPDKSETLPAMSTGNPALTPTLNRGQKTPQQRPKVAAKASGKRRKQQGQT